MIYLILAIISSALVSIVMRIGKSKTKSSAGMFMMNYFVCAVLSLFFIKGFNPFVQAEKMNFSVFLGIFSGFLFLASFAFLETNIKKNGVVLSSIFMKLGIIIPVLTAIFVFKETVKINHIIGLILAVTAIILMNYEKGNKENKGLRILLILLLLVSGVTELMSTLYDKLGNPEISSNYLFFVFISALFFSTALYFIKKEKLCKWDLIFGAILAFPNYFSSRFLLKSLSSIPAVVVYPTYSIATIVLIGLAGVFFFKEKLSKLKIIGIVLVLGTLVLLNI